MDNGGYIEGQGIFARKINKAIPVHIIRVFALDQVLPFGTVGKIIDNKNVVPAKTVQLPQQGAPDKARASSYHYHPAPSQFWLFGLPLNAAE